jgi:hypothetical protein
MGGLRDDEAEERGAEGSDEASGGVERCVRIFVRSGDR